MQFFTGVSYRHCLVLRNKENNLGELVPPHDISGKCVGEYLPKSEENYFLFELMKKCHEVLKNHPINLERIKRGKRPANSIWLWGNGTKKQLPSFREKFGLNASVISAVDLIKGIGKLTKMEVIDVPGATGYIDTNFKGKALAAISAFNRGSDLVYLHLEAPDECGHRFEIENKVKSLEIIDEEVLSPIVDALNKTGDYKIMILPDHPTPLALKTHTGDPVPFLIYHKNDEKESGVTTFNEDTAAQTGKFIENGSDIMSIFISE
ncbi:MAG: phosphoglycerate mutase, partial [Oscillospiraceae bacterium]